MWILTPNDNKDEGAYAVKNAVGEKVVFMFEEEDDCERYHVLLSATDHQPMNVLEISDAVAIAACERANVRYTIITKDDIVIPLPE
tara:strand:- start:473 stop:730 length:258 start_codon:yes stop_codon:yes gene_type:complete